MKKKELSYKIIQKDGNVVVELSVENFDIIYNNHLLMEKILKDIQEVQKNDRRAKQHYIGTNNNRTNR